MGVYDACARICDAKGLSLTKICKSIGIDSKTLHRWNAKSTIKPQTTHLRELSEALGVEPLDLLWADLDTTGEYYKVNGVNVTSLKDKLYILMAVRCLSTNEMAMLCQVNDRNFYRWSKGECGMSSESCELIARACNIPMYVLADSEEPLRVKGYAAEEVLSSSASNVKYNLRAIWAASGKSREYFCHVHGISNKTLEVLCKKDHMHMNTVRQLAYSLMIEVRDLLGDYTTSPSIHFAFEMLDPLDRMKFMMTLKGVTPAYLVETFSWSSTEIFSGKPKSMPMEIPFILARYFGCPHQWFTQEKITLERGQTLRTQWNEII